MRQADVTDADIRNVLSIWETCLEQEDAGEICELLSRPAWHLFEAEQYLITAACIYLGMPPPKNVAFSCLDHIERACDCEVTIFWANRPSASFDPERFVAGAAVRISEYDWPGFDLAIRTNEHIKYVIWRMALLKKTADKEAPECIFGR